MNKGDFEILPICRARHQDSLVPGTLLKNDTCRIGFGWNTHIYSGNFDILSFDPCKSVQTVQTKNLDYEDFDF